MCLKTILARRSVRRYTSQPVADSDIADLLAAAMAAPSAGGARHPSQSNSPSRITPRQISGSRVEKLCPYLRLLPVSVNNFFSAGRIPARAPAKTALPAPLPL